jgi:MSHA biogenesis protein MshE
VFSTLHTMNAVATIHRLLDMGAAGYMIAAAVHGIVAQRLVRRVCENCAQDTPADEHQLAWLHAQVGSSKAGAMRFRTGLGCTYCNLSGYRGRAPVYELLEIDRGLADAIRRGDSAGFADGARSRPGYVSLAQGALQLATQGLTSLAEAIAVTSGLEEADEPGVAGDPLVADALAEARVS